MPDTIFLQFLERQLKEAWRMNEASDVIDIVPRSPQHYEVIFHCTGFVKSGRMVETAEEFRAGIYFGPNHLRRPYVCFGNMRAGVGLTEIVHQIYEMIGWRRYTLTHAMNWDAAQWARQNMHRIPASDRPLYRRVLNLKFTGQSRVSRPPEVSQ
jgi:hypothetical protein